MENPPIFNRETIYFYGPFPMAMLNNQRVDPCVIQTCIEGRAIQVPRAGCQQDGQRHMVLPLEAKTKTSGPRALSQFKAARQSTNNSFNIHPTSSIIIMIIN